VQKNDVGVAESTGFPIEDGMAIHHGGPVVHKGH